MRLDAELRSYILDIWPDVATRKRVADVLTRLPQPLRLMCVPRGRSIAAVDATTLIVTENAIGYGWPMVLVAWRRS